MTRTPPHNLDNERAALGSVMLAAVSFDVMRKHITATDFYNTAHQVIWDAIEELYTAGKPIEIVTLTDELKRSDKLQAVGGPAYVVGLEDFCLTPSNSEYYARRVKEDALRRKRIETATDTIEKLYGDAPIDEVLAEDRKAQDDLLIELDLVDQDWVNLGNHDFVAEMADKYAHNEKCDEPVPSFLYHVNKFSGGGYSKGELSFIVGPPSAGKTRFCVAEMLHVVKHGGIAAFFSTELRPQQTWEYIIKQEAGYKDPEIGKGYSNNDLLNIGAAHKRLQPMLNRKLWMKYDPILSPARIETWLALLKAKEDVRPDLVVVDHFTRLNSDAKRRSSVEEEDEKAKALAAVAGKFQPAILLIWHPFKDDWTNMNLTLKSGRGSGMLGIVSKLGLTLSKVDDDDDSEHAHELRSQLVNTEDEVVRLASVKVNKGGKKDHRYVAYVWDRGLHMTFDEYRTYYEHNDAPESVINRKDWY